MLEKISDNVTEALEELQVFLTNYSPQDPKNAVPKRITLSIYTVPELEQIDLRMH